MPQTVCTIYGCDVVHESVLIRLIVSDAMQRLRGVHQYGFDAYIKNETALYNSYTRYEHSLGVFMLLRLKGAPLVQQVAGLLHDASHTAFSHVGDYVMRSGDYKGSCYQDAIHADYLAEAPMGSEFDMSILDYLRSHAGALGFDIGIILDPKGAASPSEAAFPNVSADNLEYILYGGLMARMLTRADVRAIAADVRLDGNRWVFSDVDLAEKFAMVPLHLTITEWGGPDAFYVNVWAADALKRAVDIGLITLRELHHSTDAVLLPRLLWSEDPYIHQALCMLQRRDEIYACDVGSGPRECHHIHTFMCGSYKVCHTKDEYCWGVRPMVRDLGLACPKSGQVSTVYSCWSKRRRATRIKTKMRAVDPWVGDQRLSALRPAFAREFHRVRVLTLRGWDVKFPQWNA